MFPFLGNWEELDSEQQITSQLSVSIDPAKVKFFYFPDFEDQNLKDDMVSFSCASFTFFVSLRVFPFLGIPFQWMRHRTA